MNDRKRLAEGGAKDRASSLDPGEDPALVHESRQAVLNQGKAVPSDYPDRHAKTPDGMDRGEAK
jgi:hypothetical protein